MKKFKVPEKLPTTSKSIRFPNELIDEVEKIIQEKNCTFIAFVVEAVDTALNNMKVEEIQQELNAVTGDCTPSELQAITEISKTTKNIIRKLQ